MLTIFIATAMLPRPAAGYAAFTHEDLIDLAWNDSIRPLLLRRYPRTTADGLITAHAFA